MSDLDLTYIGPDRIFYKKLCDCSDRMGIHCRHAWPISNAYSEMPNHPSIVLIEPKFLINPNPHVITFFKKADLAILILNQNDDISLYNKMLCFHSFDSIWIKSDNLIRIQKNILICSRLLSKTLSTSSSQMHHLIKKNHHLSSQIAHLQEQINHADKEMQIQEKVIGKINQISHLSRQINSLDLNQIASVCTNNIPKLILARFASIYSYDLKTHTLRLLHHNHPYTIENLVALNDHPESVMVAAIRQKRIMLIEDLSNWNNGDYKYLNLPFNRNYRTNSCIIAPLISGGEVLGVLNMADKIDGSPFSVSVDLPPIQLLCEIIGSAMTNIRLYEAVQKQAVTDGLTGLLNHRTFFDSLAKEVHRAKRYGNCLSLLMIDMDNLKQINDQHGHQAGDTALLNIAESISTSIRDTDIASRYGGDEFAVILPNTSLSDALIVAERLIRHIDTQSLKIHRGHMPISVSVGLSQYDTDFSPEQFTKQADIALIQAKKAGKNRIHVMETAHS